MEIRELLNDEVQKELNALSVMTLGTEEHKHAVDGLIKLADRAIELEKLEHNSLEKEKDRELQEKAREIEENLRREQAKVNRLDMWIRNGIAIAGIVIPSVLTVWGTFKTFKFEEEGTITTTMGRGFISKLIPKK